MSASYNKPLPDTGDPLMAPFWAAARQHRVAAQRCRACGQYRWPPRPICPECLEPGGEWVAIADRGQVWSYVVYHRAFHPGFADDIPYAVAVVELEHGVRFEGQVVGAPESVTIGAPAIACYDDVTEEVTLIKWKIEHNDATG